jgi:DNA primase
MGRCCFHEDRVPSLAVYPESQTFHCFGCGKGGDVITFLMELEGVSFREALWILRQSRHAA